MCERARRRRECCDSVRNFVQDFHGGVCVCEVKEVCGADAYTYYLRIIQRPASTKYRSSNTALVRIFHIAAIERWPFEECT
eukprot:1943692-Pyramimonas_sp.AAC.2